MTNALIAIGYGALTLSAFLFALASRRLVVIGATTVFLFDYGAANYILARQGFPNALWAWPVINIICALAICILRLVDPRKSLTLVALFYVLRTGIDIQHAFVGGVFPYTLETNLVFILQLAIVSMEGRNGMAAGLAGLWRRDQRHGLMGDSGLASVRPTLSASSPARIGRS